MRQNILGVPYSNYYDENEFFIFYFFLVWRIFALFWCHSWMKISQLDKKAQLWVFFCPILWHSWMNFLFFSVKKTQFPLFKLCIFIFSFWRKSFGDLKNYIEYSPFLSKTSCQKWKLKMKKKPSCFYTLFKQANQDIKEVKRN